MIGRMNRVTLFVPNMQECAKFYSDALGLQPHGHADDHWMTFDAGGCFISLHHVEQRPLHIEGKAVQIVFKVDDVAATRGSLIGKGVRMGELVHADATLTFCDGQDPASNWFQISSR